MSGQAVVGIGDKEWFTDVATLPWELSQGLGDLVELPSANGMLFDVGFEQIIEVTTVPMLFPLDIAFISEDLTITEVYRDIEPGYLVTSQLPARYFLEVNAGELAEIEPGASVSVEYLVTEGMAPAASDLISTVVPFVGFLTVSAISILVMRDMVNDLLDDEESFLIQQGNDASGLQLCHRA